MGETIHTAGRFAARALSPLLALSLAATAHSASADQAELAQQPLSTDALVADALVAPALEPDALDADALDDASSFAAVFHEVIEPLDPDLSNANLALPADAVDLDSFEPPQGPRVIRSLGTGIASYYGRRFHGRRTANGERFDMSAMTAAHKTLPFGSLVRVTNPRNGRSVTVRINDRGPFIRGREIDLSRAAAERIGMIQSGHARVQLELVAR